MKKTLKQLNAVLIGSLLIATAVNAAEVTAKAEKPGLLRRIFCKLSWEEVETVVDTPKSICAAVRHAVEYKSDLGDEWTSGKETWEKGTGDCEDFAIAIVELCKKKGIDASIQVFYPKGSMLAHAVAVGEYKGKTWISSNGWFQYVKSMDHAKREVAFEAGWRTKEIMVATPDQLAGNGLYVAQTTRPTLQ